MFGEINDNASVTYASIRDGRVIVKVPQGTEGSKSRVNKMGNTVFEKEFKFIMGHIKTIDVAEDKFGSTNISVALEFKEKRAVLQFGWNSAYGRTFLNQIFHVDFNKMVVFNPWSKVFEDGTKRNALYLSYTTGEKVKNEPLKDAPEVKWVKTKKGNVLDVASKINWDEWMTEQLQNFIKANNLVYVKQEEFVPLNAEELKEYEAMKKNKKDIIEGNDIDTDDFFNAFK